MLLECRCCVIGLLYQGMDQGPRQDIRAQHPLVAEPLTPRRVTRVVDPVFALPDPPARAAPTPPVILLPPARAVPIALPHRAPVDVAPDIIERTTLPPRRRSRSRSRGRPNKLDLYQGLLDAFKTL